ncbi:heavy metal translocating P-type ATPase [Albibacterium bauzanense]|uniref:Cu+-exporting ATPase n=1 Tax=Albibacterium bauzanense TaxID=653929 RepID=A0A4R1M7I7_9SPHI|nr:heavy metal translocating P-type ATPase metal-binding domain-containing protein [Albibacterium bauzanense]TCK85663.1 Cu+-exporting ATPase [Albibacterium bauzanense]
MQNKAISEKIYCFHCGDPVYSDLFQEDNHEFCCLGCQSVYTILSTNNLKNYYKYNDHPGKAQDKKAEHLEYLNEPKIAQKLIDFQDNEYTHITVYIPAIHCSSCIWLLENLYKLNASIVQSRIDFTKKQAAIKFKHSEISLKELIELLIAIGYEPIITLQDVVKKQKTVNQNSLVRKIAVAGFCFGNVMLFSLPEYFGFGAIDKEYATLFNWLNLSFALPVLLYSAKDYFISAYNSLKLKQVNLDVPLALGIFILFLRSAVEIIAKSGPGFSDTLCGLVFFILIGKWIQNRTFYHLSFERDYRSYFPVAVTSIQNKKEQPKAIADLEVGERILIRNNEIIPADAILLKGKAAIDFSFVTGESNPVKKTLGEIIYAGGRQLGEAIELEIVKSVSQSYLTNLWNNENYKQYKRKFQTFSNSISKYFTIVLLAIATSAAIFWLFNSNTDKAWAAFTAVLIIACPCALALSSPFTLSAALSIFDKNRFFIKNTGAIEQLAKIDSLVFDKTGTITSPKSQHIQFKGDLKESELQAIASICRNSSHPLSIQIVNWLKLDTLKSIQNYQEIPGKGIQANVNGNSIKIGSANFTKAKTEADAGSRVYVAIDNEIKGYFSILQPWRKDLSTLISDLKTTYDLHLISGDQDKDREVLQEVFPTSNMRFNQLPQEKLNYIQNLQSSNKIVCMIGDGLNDAGALKQANFGIAISDDINSFSPGCDAILEGSSLNKLPQFLTFAQDAMKVIYFSFIISLSYNVIGLFFAIQGTMSPLFAAILMPLSTITIISFTSITTHIYARKNKLKSS